METPTLIYCADGNRRFAGIAVSAGYRYGAQLPNTVYFPLYFADQNWKKPNRTAYMAALMQYRPEMATVLDWEREEQLPEVLSWAEEAAQYAKTVLIIPKVQGGIKLLPRKIGSADVRLGLSVPTKYGGTQLPVWEFVGWPVHLLGGSPRRQVQYALHIPTVVSVDGNYMQMMATRYCEYWDGRRWRELADAGGFVETDAPYEAFRRSCENIMSAWAKL